MKKNNKAFTLIELLAVIVVLTIILLITVPAINEVIKNSRKEAFKNNVLNLFEAVKKLESNSDYRLDEEGIKYNDKRLNISNNPFTGGKIYLNANGEADSDKITDDKFCAVGTKKKLLIAEGDCDLAAALSNIDFKQKPSKQGWYRGKEITVDIKGFESYPYTFSFSVDGGKTFHKIENKETPLLFGIYKDGDTTTEAKDFYEREYHQKFNNNLDDANILVRVSYGNDSLATAYKVTMVDSTAPTDATVRLVRRNTDTMYVLANAVENDSYITKYEFKIDDGNYVDNGGEPSFKFSNVTQEAHRVTVRISNVVGDSVEVSQVFDPAELVAPTITATPGGTEWHKKKTVTMTFPMNREDASASMKNDYVYQYKTFAIGADSAAVDFITISEKECEVTTASSPCKITTDSVGNKVLTYKFELIDNRNVIAQVSAGTNKKAHTAVIDKVDGIDPTIKGISPYATASEIRLHINGEDNPNGSGIAKYECSIDGNSWHDANGTVCIFSGLNKETQYKMDVRAIDNAGNTSTGHVTFSTVAQTPVITFKETREGKGKKITIQYPNLGSAAVYEYKIGNGEWIKTTSLSQITSLITVNNTPVYARVSYNGEYIVSATINVVVDITPPTCSWAGPAKSPIKNGTTTTYTLTCTDDYGTFSDNAIAAADIESSNSGAAAASAVSGPTAVTNGFKWTVTVKAGASSHATAQFRLKAGAIADTAGNKNAVTAYSSAVRNDSTGPSVTFGTNGGGWAKSRSTTVKATDSYSGISSVKYQWSTSTTAPTSFGGTVANGGTVSGSGVTGTYYLWIQATDSLGNVTKVRSNAFYFDNTAPSITASNSSGSNWTFGKVIISGKVSDGHSGINASTIQYSYNKSSTATDWSSKSTTAYSGTWSAARNQPVYVRVADNAGNWSAWVGAGYVRIFSALKTGSEVWSGVTYTSSGNSGFQVGSTIREDNKTSTQVCHEWYCQAYVAKGNFGGSHVSTNWGISYTMSGIGYYAKSGWKDFSTHCAASGSQRSSYCEAYYGGSSGRQYVAGKTAYMTSSLTG